MKASLKRHLAALLRTAGVTLLVVLVVAYALHWRRVRKLRALRPQGSLADMAARAEVPLEVMRAMGMMYSDDRRHLAAVAPEHPGTVRIGAFGDSFTFGDEVMAGFDYPSQLRRLLAARGFGDVEVVNFGAGWSGLDQATMLYERFARRLTPDVLLFGPQGFWTDREQTFCHTVDDGAPYYLHGRYVLDGDDVRFLDPAGGDDLDARFAAYFAFWPRWRYLRYDRSAPQALRAWLPVGRHLDNPFYYSRLAPARERDLLDRRLFARLTAGGAEAIVTVEPRELDELVRTLAPRVAGALLPLPRTFPHRRPLRHLSGSGNLWLARVYADLLTGADVGQQPTLVTHDLTRGGPPGPTELSRVHGVGVRLGEQVVGRLIHPVDAPVEIDRLVDPARDGVRALLLLTNDSALDSAWVFAPPAPLRPGAKVELHARTARGELRRPLGELRPLNGLAAVSVLRHPDIDPFGYRALRFARDEELAGVERAELTIDGEPAFELRFDRFSYTVHAVRWPRYVLTSAPDVVVDPTRLPPRGEIALELTVDDGVQAFPVAEWQLQPTPVPVTAPPARILRHAAGNRSQLGARP